VHFIDDPAFAGGIGRELVAADIAYSIKRHFDPATRSQAAWKWQGRIAGLEEWKAAGANYDVEAEGIRALDRYTLQIKLIKPYPQLLDTLADATAGVVPREAVEHYGREFAIHPVGSGPFRLVDWKRSRAAHRRSSTASRSTSSTSPPRAGTPSRKATRSSTRQCRTSKSTWSWSPSTRSA
jgi:oligopeptide transport system substrate-binding protein